MSVPDANLDSALPDSKGVGGFESWRRSRTDGRGRRLMMLASVGLIGMATVAALCYSLFKPFDNPDIHLLILSAPQASESSLQGELALPDYSQNDAAAFSQFATTIHQYAPDHSSPEIVLRTPSEWNSLGNRLKSVGTGDGHAFLLYVAATGVSVDGVAYLEFPATVPGDPPLRLRVKDALEQICSSKARIKFLMLDAQRREFDLNTPLIVNEFPRLLREAVEDTDDPSLWVLNSHSVLEQSHISQRAQRSEFSLAVIRGLKGEADRNADGTVGILELHQFVSETVSSRVLQATGHYQSQNPLICWGGGRPSHRMDVALIPVTNHADAKEEPGTASPQTVFPPSIKLADVQRFLPASAIAMPHREAIAELPDVLKSLLAGGESDQLPAESTAIPDQKKPAKKTEQVSVKSAPAEKLAAGSTEPPPTSTTGNIGERIIAAWLLRDQLVDSSLRAVTPIDTLPVSWRKLELRLLNCELRYRRHGPFAAEKPKPDAKEAGNEESKPPTPRELLARRLSDDVDDVLRLMQSVGSLKRQQQPPTTRLEKSIDKSLAAIQNSPRTSQSLGLAEWCHLCCETCMAGELQLVIGEFDRLLASGTPSEFFDWIAKLKADHRQYQEIRIAARFAQAGHLKWSEIRMALSARRYAEQIAAASHEEWRWVGTDVLNADRQLADAERQLHDGLGADHVNRARGILTAAVRRYADVAERLRLLRRAKSLTAEVQYRAADLLRWQQSVDEGPDDLGPGSRLLTTLFQTVHQLDGTLNSPTSAADIDIVRRLTATLAALQPIWRQRLQNGVASVSRRIVDGRDPLPGDLSRIQVLLGTPLLKANARLAALQAIDHLKKAANEQPVLTATRTQGPGDRRLGRTDWNRLLRRADLNVRLAELVSEQGRDDSFHSVSNALNELETQSRNDAITEKALWKSHRLVAKALNRFYTDRQRILESQSDRLPNSLLQTNSDFAKARVLTGLQRSPSMMSKLIEHRGDSRLRLAFTQQAQRLQVALQDASGRQRTSLQKSLEELRAEAAELSRDMTFPNAESAGVEFGPAKSLSLIDSSSGEIVLPINNLGTKAIMVRAVVEFDGDLLAVQCDSRFALRMARGGNLRANSLREALETAPQFTLSTSNPHALRLLVARRRKTAAWPTQVIVHVRAGRNVFRQSIPVRLPSPKSVELHLTSADTGAAGRRQLQPFPNRVTTCRARLRSLIRQDRIVDVSLFTPQNALPPIPESELTASEFTRWRDRLGPMKEIAAHKNLALDPRGGWSDVKLQAPVAKTPMPANPEAPPAFLTNLDKGLLLLIRDRKTGAVSLRPYSVAVQRPRRFLRTSASFDQETRRLQIQISAKEVSGLPPGPVQVRCELSPALPAGLPAKLDGEITAENSDLRLFADIPATLGRSIRADIHIDGYPRAFVYRIAMDRTMTHIREDVSRQRVVVTIPPGKAIATGTNSSVPVNVRVDAPVGSFESGADLVAIGVDSNRDRVFDDESYLKLPSDRDVVVGIASIGDEGGILIRSTVSDWSRTINLSRYANRRVNLLGRLTVNGKSTWSGVAPALMDAEPPIIQPLRSVTAVEAGTATLPIAVTDAGLSGVATVELAVDLVGLGQFSKDPPPTVAAAGPQGQWIGTLSLEKLKPGVYPVIVRATDRAGNVSKVAKTRLAVLTKAQAAELAKPKPNRVAGVVIFDGDTIPGATVTLQPIAEKSARPPAPDAKPAAVEIPPVESDEKGRFLFPKVPPGNYRVIAKKRAVANKNRTGRAAIAVPKFPQATPVQRVELH